MNEQEPSGEPVRSLGQLKLPEADAERFLDAIHAYGYERSVAFLRQCAYAMMRNHEAGTKLELPLDFKCSPLSHVEG